MVCYPTLPAPGRARFLELVSACKEFPARDFLRAVLFQLDFAALVPLVRFIVQHFSAQRVELLSPLLASGRPEVREAALQAVGLDFLRHFSRLVTQLDARTRDQLAAAVARLNEEGLRRMLEGLLAVAPETRKQALQFLVVSRDRQEMEAHLGALGEDPGGSLRAALTAGLDALGSLKALGTLLEMLGELDIRARNGPFGPMEPNPLTRLREAVAPFLKDPNERVRDRAARWLRDWPGESEAPPASASTDPLPPPSPTS